MGKLMNLGIFSLTFVAVSAIYIESGLSITLIHWDSNLNGSYLTLMSNPLKNSTYHIAVNTGTDDSSLYYTISNQLHDIYGLAQVPIKWPEKSSGNQLNINITDGPDVVKKVSVSVQSTEPAAGSNAIYYPRDHQTANVSLMHINGSWLPVWDNNMGQIWLLNESDPQQVEVIGFTSNKLNVFCFVCKSGISSELGDYVVTITSTSNQTLNFTLNGQATDSDGIYQTDLDTAFHPLTYNVTFKMESKGKVKTTLVFSGSVSSIPSPSTSYKSVYHDGPRQDNVYLNEVHFSNSSANVSAASSFWMEIIGPVNTNLSNYCVLVVVGLPNKTAAASGGCLPLGNEAVIQSNGYYIYSPDFSSKGIHSLHDLYILSSSPDLATPAKISMYLHRINNASMTIVDRINFVWKIPNAAWTCVGDEKLFCLQNSVCDYLCLDPAKLLQKSGFGISRCGIQKDPKLKMKKVSMALWYVERTTLKRWNTCRRPLGYLSRMELDKNKITVQTIKDGYDLDDMPVELSHLHLPNMGLQFTFWHGIPGANIMPMPLKGADLTIDESADNYPMLNMTITLSKSNETSVSGANLYASGGITKSFVRPYVYVIALVHHYSFLPAFDIYTQKDQVVDAVVYCPGGVSLDVPTVSMFMGSPALEQGQLILDKSTRPVIENTVGVQRQMSSWKGRNSLTGDLYELDQRSIADEIQQSLRIMRVGNNKNPYVQLKLVDVPKDYVEFLEDGLSLENLCLTVVVRAGNLQEKVAFALMAGTISIGETITKRLIPVTSSDIVFPLTHRGILSLFRNNNQSSQACPHPISMNNPNSDAAYRQLIDVIKIGYKSSSADDLVINDNTEVARCNSMKVFYDDAFSVVDVGAECPVPHHLYIYKLCHRRIGIASELSQSTPMPTDYLYLLSLDDNNKVLNITSLHELSPLLKWKRNMILAPNFIIVSADKVTSFSLSWYPRGPPQVNSTVTNNTISLVVSYPAQDMLADAQRRLTSVLQTAESPQDARRPVVMYAPHVKDRRHCVIGCDRHQEMSDLIDFETDNFTIEDNTCDLGYTQQYRDIRINELNSDTVGFKDEGEFIELKGDAMFKYASGLSIAVLQAEDGDMIYSDLVHVTDVNKTFDSEGYFLFEHTNFNHTWSSLPYVQNLPYNRFIPNKYGAIALLWGAQLVDGVAKHSTVIESHLKLPDFFLDVVIYARDQEVARDEQIETLMEQLSKGPKQLTGQVGLEILGAVSYKETISRCFCKDSFDMSCFEMSFHETRKAENICPTLHSKPMQFCSTPNSVSDAQIAVDISLFMSNDLKCNNMSCSFSKFQVKGFSSCLLGTQPPLELRNFSVGFPTLEQLNRVGPLITAESLKDFGANYISLCPEARCPAPSTSPRSHQYLGVIIGVTAALVAIALIIITIIIVKKRQKRSRHLSARYEAGQNEEDDDDTFLPDNGSISFSNPWYNQSNGSAVEGNENGSKKQYQKLSTST